MPMNGAIVLADVRADKIIIECNECGRRGEFSTRRAIQNYGRTMGLPRLLTLTVRAAGCPNVDNLALQGCKARYSDETQASWSPPNPQA